MKLFIKNAKVEVGYEVEGDQVVATKTADTHILIEDGIIKEIGDVITAEKDAQIIDAQGQLIVPALKDMHIHLDKTYFSGEWKAPTPMTEGILTRIKEEMWLLPQQLDVAEQRARAIVDHCIANGHTHIRSHCNVDQQIGIKHIEITKKVLDSYGDKITYDIVAFPQHGLLRSDVESLMREALQIGATHVGGVDPATIDRNIMESLKLTFELAMTYGKDVDMHIHDRDTLGEFEFHRIMDIMDELNFPHAVTISHAMALADLTGDALETLTNRMAQHKIDVTTTVPIGQSRPTIPIPYLYNNGVHVSLGHDSLTDHWSPFGTGNTIHKLNTFVQRFRYIDERSIGQSLKYATGGITPLTENGEKQWPHVGDPANLLLVDAVSSAHLIARVCPITTVISKGVVIHEQEITLKGEFR